MSPQEPTQQAAPPASASTAVRDGALHHLDTVRVYESPPELIPAPEQRSIHLPASAFKEVPKGGKGIKKTVSSEPYLILGFDTEFKTPDYMVNRDQIVAGEAKYRVLSYQYHAKTSDGREWQGICCPEGEDRMTLGAFIVFALGQGVQDHGFVDLPRKIYLVGHFTRADIPAFADFKDLTAYLSNVRNTFISIDSVTNLVIHHDESTPKTTLQILFRDTLLLTPQASRSLKEIGKLVGQPKMELDPDPVKHKEMIRNMDRVRAQNWEVFKAYALNDATICVRYIESVIAQFEEVTGSKKVPVTLTSIGIELLLKTWREKIQLNPLAVLGKEEIDERYFDKKRGYYAKKRIEVDIEQVRWHLDFVTECYHGGRNEQFWFGPAFEDDWTDFDLSSAYPTAMSLIGLPDWRNIREETDPVQFTATTLGFAYLEFEFPEGTRFPTLPVRTNHGLVFPLKGICYCAAPEIAVALELGAKITILRGLIVPTDPGIRIFGEFIKECLDQRKAAGSKTLKGLFWKEISNSTYGKTAQGLREKRVFDMRDKSTKLLPPSKITNPFFAAFITSFVRGILGEIVNNLDADTCVFSCTTDGFLTNASEAEIGAAQEGVLCKFFEEARETLTGTGSVLEKKHQVRKPLGWRTRGQATLIAGNVADMDETYTVILAKGGIFTPPEFEGVEDQNTEIVRMFYERSPSSVIRVEGKTGVRDMVNHDADLVEKVFEKRLNMEYDWKRKPFGVNASSDGNGSPSHLVFSTRPWETVAHFETVREAWESYIKDGMICLKTVQDYEEFARHVQIRSLTSSTLGKYMKKKDGDVVRLRQMLCSAWHRSAAGLVHLRDGVTANGFAALLSRCRIPCSKFDVENGKKKEFLPHACPPTLLVEERLALLKNSLPELDAEAFLYRDRTAQAISMEGAANDCPFVQRAIGG